jgi:ATP dependent DNA ligase domain
MYEEKVDGWRIVAYKAGREVRLVSRKGVDHTARFPELAQAVAALPGTKLVLDGEVAVFDEQLLSQFELLAEPHPEIVTTRPCTWSSTSSTHEVGISESQRRGGRVVRGMEVADQIVNAPREGRDNPNDRIDMKVRVV